MKRLLPMLLFALLALADGTAATTPPEFRPATWQAQPAPRVAVAEGAAVLHGEQVVLAGGFTQDLEATAAIQLHHPVRGWQPVGQAMLHARAGHTLLPIDSERLLVIGGWSGRLPTETTFRPDAEIIEPLNPQRRRPVPPLPLALGARGLDGHSATTLEDGRVFVACGTHAALFDPDRETWSAPIELHQPRRHHVAMPTEDCGVLLVGGENGDIIEIVQPDATGHWQSLAWSHVESIAIQRAGLHQLSGGQGFLVGGRGSDGLANLHTWLIDPRTQSVRRGPKLPLADGVIDPLLFQSVLGVVVAGGERWTPEGPRPLSGACVMQPHTNRAWTIPDGPLPGIRKVALETGDGGLQLLGGYRFLPRADARRLGVPTAQVLSASHRIRIRGFVDAD